MRIIFITKYTGDEQLGIMTISSMLKQNGHQVEILEAEYKKVKEKLESRIPTILAYSTPTVYSDYYVQLNKRIKKDFAAFSVFGGPHPTVAPEMIEEDGIDGICIGEGELAMTELADSLNLGRPIRCIKNWWIKDGGKIFKNPLRPRIENLDELPFPDRELFKRLSLFDKEKIHVITGRGCPYECSYCCNPVYDRLYKDESRKIRRRSVPNVIEEIKQAKKRLPLKFVIFDDDIFVIPHEWLKELCRHYKKEIGLPFFCNVRADLVSYKTVECLKDAGCFSISMGIETADDNSRNDILKRNMTKEQIIEAARLIKEKKIILKASNIIGIPGSSLEADFETAKLNVLCAVDYSSVDILTPYPGTEIFNEANGNGLISYGQKRRLENFRQLFPLAVEFPYLLPLVKILIKLPASNLFRLVYRFWEGYCAYFRLYPCSFSGFFRGLKKYIKLIN